MMSSALQHLEPRIAGGQLLSRSEAADLLGTADLLSVGVLGETARKARSGDRVTYGRVAVVTAAAPVNVGDAGELRLTGVPTSIAHARERVRVARGLAGVAVLTAFSLADLLALVGDDHLALADLARALKSEGLEAIAETPMDRLGDTENAVEVVRAIQFGGLQAWRATVDVAPPEARLDLIERAMVIQRETQAFRALAPLPRHDPADEPSTGYDDVRTIAMARMMTDIAAIQVDWPLYGPKLAQVAIAYGANDVDGIAAVDDGQLGPRRAPREDIERQIRAAGAVPAERDGRYHVRT